MYDKGDKKVNEYAIASANLAEQMEKQQNVQSPWRS